MAPAASFRHGSSSRTVCVMDASGQVGASVVRRLLQRGYTVHAATQNTDFHGLKGSSPEEEKRLKIFYAEPFDYHSVLDALKGCSGLFYTFEPPQDQQTYDEYMVETEVRAAHNVLEACAQTDTVHKVVFTSSVTAVVWRDNQASPAAADLDERSWSDPAICRKFKLWHALAKATAERTAWALATDRGLNMVSVNAGLLLTPEKLTLANPYLKGAAEMYDDGVLVTVDAGFLAEAHVRAYEDPSAYGRYLCFNRLVGRYEDTVRLAKVLAPSVPCPPPSSHDDSGGRVVRQRIRNGKLSKLMKDFGDGGRLELEEEEGIVATGH